MSKESDEPTVSREPPVTDVDGHRVDEGDPVVVDDGNPMGRVDLVMLDDGSTIVSWLEAGGGQGAGAPLLPPI